MNILNNIENNLFIFNVNVEITVDDVDFSRFSFSTFSFSNRFCASFISSQRLKADSFSFSRLSSLSLSSFF